MTLSPELEAAYRDSCRPLIDGGGAITELESAMRPWRVFLEVNSACNLKCPTCTKGNKEGYEHQTGLMDPALMEQCIDKIRNENNKAIVFLYGNSEPFLNPRLPECIAAVKARGLRCEMSTNLNYVQRLDETLAAGLDYMIVSLSGFTQEVYVKGHAGGNIDKVKANMRLLGEANAKLSKPVTISVNYHVYKDNGEELEPMRAFAAECGIGLFTSTARAISMENTIQYCREHDPEATPYEVQDGQPDWNALLPPVSQQWRDTMDRLKIPPTEARKMYEKYPVRSVCPVGAGGIFTFIRHDGKIQMCSCTADRRITIGDYLSTNVNEMIERRTNHPICQQCIKYRTNLYFMIADREKWD
jgi:MoaA/NifB/PqqE/SkfB family radical SAM enzyme